MNPLGSISYLSDTLYQSVFVDRPVFIRQTPLRKNHSGRPVVDTDQDENHS